MQTECVEHISENPSVATTTTTQLVLQLLPVASHYQSIEENKYLQEITIEGQEIQVPRPGDLSTETWGGHQSHDLETKETKLGTT